MAEDEEDERMNSLCSIYVHLVRKEIEKQGAMNDKIEKFLGYIEKYCHLAPYPKGTTPEHLKPYLYEKKGEDPELLDTE